MNIYVCMYVCTYVYIYRCPRRNVPDFGRVFYSKAYRYNPKHLCPKLNGYIYIYMCVCVCVCVCALPDDSRRDVTAIALLGLVMHSAKCISLQRFKAISLRSAHYKHATIPDQGTVYLTKWKDNGIKAETVERVVGGGRKLLANTMTNSPK
jgi:hypothetical protein